MTSPVILADAELVMVTHIAQLLMDRSEPYADGATVGVSAPTSETGAPTAPHVQVEDDGTPRPRYPRTNDAIVRITCWAAGRTAAKDLGALVQGLVGSAPAPAGAWSVKGRTGPLRGYDKTARLHFASFTYRVSTRPVR